MQDGVRLMGDSYFSPEDPSTVQGKLHSLLNSRGYPAGGGPGFLGFKSTLNSAEIRFMPAYNGGTQITLDNGISILGLVLGIVFLLFGLTFIISVVIFILWYMKADEVKKIISGFAPPYGPPPPGYYQPPPPGAPPYP